MTLNQGKHKSLLVNLLKDIYTHPVFGLSTTIRNGHGDNHSFSDNDFES